MSEIADRFRRAAAQFTARVEGVPEDRWGAPSPCAGWDARDVVRHLVDNCTLFLGLVGRELPEGPSVDTDPAAAWPSARDAVQADLDDPELAAEEYDGQFGRKTFAWGVDSFLTGDVVVHTWDLARATGQDERLDAAEVARIFEEARALGEMARGEGIYGPEVEAPTDADEQTRMLAFLGRRS